MQSWWNLVCNKKNVYFKLQKSIIMEKLVLINNEQIFEKLKPELSKEFELVWFPSVHVFEQTMIDKDVVRAIVICESYPEYISLRNELVFARFYGNKQPIILLSKLPYKHIVTNPDYNLTCLEIDDAHKYLQLPVSGLEIINTINEAKVLDKAPETLPFVINNQIYIDHIINRENNNEFSNMPVHKVLLIEDTPKDIETAIMAYKNYLKEKSLDFKFEIKYILRGDDAENIIMKDTDIQSVLLDWLLLEKNGATQDHSQKKLVETIYAIRPELPIYILTLSENPYDIINVCENKIKTYFTKKQFYSDPTSVFNRIVSDYNKRRSAPFWEAYRNYIEESNDSWHTPGHARGVSFRESPYLNGFYNYFGVNMFGADLSVSVEKLGSLLDSTNSIKEAQEKAAKSFGSNHVFFTTNGSSTSNKVIIQTMLRPGDGVVIDRNCHKSVHYGVIQAGVGHITYLNSEYSSKYRIFAPPSLQEIKQGIAKAKEECDKVKALIITGCTYDGLLIDVKQVVELAHKEGLKVFIDEAWFAYSHFHPNYRKYSAIDARADYVTHSVHKVLSALSQASVIHVNDPDFDEDYFREIFFIYTSTSPQYHMIASIDVAAMQMEMEGYKKISETLKLANRFRDSIKKSFKKILIVEHNDFSKEFPHIKTDNVGHDALKVLMDMSQLDYEVDEIHRYLFEEGGLEIEKDTFTTILVLFTMGTSPDKIGRLYKALSSLDSGSVNLKKKKKEIKEVATYGEIKLMGKPSDAFFTKKREEKKIDDLINHIEENTIISAEEVMNNGDILFKKDEVLDGEKIEKVNISLQRKIKVKTSKSQDIEVIEISELLDRINNAIYVSTNLVTPYPPGIPMIVPNQIITKDILDRLKELISDNVNIHGCHNRKIWVAKNSDVN